ncbi:hypothetical protein FQB35_04420 [Crassaminicella thermophila]|uniref:Uncharacterized protein n=1 Tax=Crassaminicella thermophila TaxID=2599308 RepID=A0A5C0SAR5_CRATE|nr:hypothetical protein [Crassaminicella thermophila]QEK11665.1 hypothetical protein FQB35_04420 [Crassaminicella thermophila]
MNSKAIKSVLAKKHKELCNSIKDENVRKLVEKNTIITGGCIVSLLNNEDVNDFDFYFRDKETTLAVSRYYVGRFNQRQNKSVASVVVGNHINRLEDMLAENEEEIKELEEKIVKRIPENSKVYDPDRIRVWVQSSGVAGEMQEEESLNQESFDLDKEEKESVTIEKYEPVWLSSNAITLKGKVQLIVRFYGEPNKIHENFDFVHCTCYWDSRTGKLELPSKALEAILTKQLIYVGSKYPLCSIIRTRKFIKRGYTINAGQYLKMAMQLNEFNLKDIDVLEDQLIGVDSAYFAALIEQIKTRQSNDPGFTWNLGYVTSIIDKIF